MANPIDGVLEVDSIVLWKALKQLGDRLTTAIHFDKETYFDDNPMIGTSIKLRYPTLFASEYSFVQEKSQPVQQRYEIMEFVDADEDNPIGNFVSAPLDIDWRTSMFSLATKNKDEFWRRYMSNILMSMGVKVNRIAVTALEKNATDILPSSDPTASLNGLTTITSCNSFLQVMGLVNRNALFAVSPRAFDGLQVPYATYFNQPFNSPILNENLQYGKFSMSGLDVYVDQQIPTHQNGTWEAAGDVTITSLTQVGYPNQYTILVLGGLTAGATINEGDHIYIEDPATGVILNMIDPEEKVQYFGTPKAFRVMVGDTATGGGVATIQINPALVGPDANVDQLPSGWQNIAVNPADLVGGVVTVFGEGNTVWTKNIVYTEGAGSMANPAIPQAPQKTQYKSVPYFVNESIQVPESQLDLKTLITSDGSQNLGATRIIARAAAAAVSFQGFTFVVASKA